MSAYKPVSKFMMKQTVGLLIVMAMFGTAYGQTKSRADRKKMAS